MSQTRCIPAREKYSLNGPDLLLGPPKSPYTAGTVGPNSTVCNYKAAIPKDDGLCFVLCPFSHGILVHLDLIEKFKLFEGVILDGGHLGQFGVR